MNFYEYSNAQGSGCVVCGSTPVQFHHLLIQKHGRRGHKFQDYNVIRLCPRHHQGQADAAHSMKQAAFAEMVWGSESLMWQALFEQLAGYTLALEEKLNEDE